MDWILVLAEADSSGMRSPSDVRSYVSELTSAERQITLILASASAASCGTPPTSDVRFSVLGSSTPQR